MLTLFWFRHGSQPRTNLFIFIWYISISLENVPPSSTFSLLATHPLPTPPPYHPSSRVVKDAPSAASKPHCSLPVWFTSTFLPTHDLRPDRKRPPTASPTKACLFHKPRSFIPLGAHLTIWVWVWAPAKGAPSLQEPPNLDMKTVAGFCCHLGEESQQTACDRINILL